MEVRNTSVTQTSSERDPEASNAGLMTLIFIILIAVVLAIVFLTSRGNDDNDNMDDNNTETNQTIEDSKTPPTTLPTSF